MTAQGSTKRKIIQWGQQPIVSRPKRELEDPPKICLCAPNTTRNDTGGGGGGGGGGKGGEITKVITRFCIEWYKTARYDTIGYDTTGCHTVRYGNQIQHNPARYHSTTAYDKTRKHLQTLEFGSIYGEREIHFV